MRWIEGKRSHAKVWTNDIEEAALGQIKNMVEMPFIHKHIAIMPDVHYGKGATVGSVIPTIGAIIPAAVGVDIGCGMLAIHTNLKATDLPDDLSKLRSDIEAAVPVGFAFHDTTDHLDSWDIGLMKAEIFTELKELNGLDKKDTAAKQIGTLGGGNHFIELCLDNNDDVWVMLHSGSRGIGNQIGTQFIAEAKKDMERHFISLPDMDLAYLIEGSIAFNDYVKAVEWAQHYAERNRHCILRLVHGVLRKHFPMLWAEMHDRITSCHHNYISRENHYGKNCWITRKGAVSAKEGQWGIIPGSMGTGSFIVRGKGNQESFHSCSHGAGRKMSRNEARKTFTLEDHAKATAGVECRKDDGVLDETPGAYKSLDEVMANQSDLVEIVYKLKTVLCVKG